MKSSYKALGDYIRQVKLRNRDSSLSEPMGINISKFFMPSVANTNGTDLSKYRVVKNGQFAYNPMHVGRDEVLPIALLKGKNKIIVSPAYTVFEIIDEQVLLPEYLMMWFRRKDFDRNAWFTTDNSVRGGFSWESLCNMELPIPSPHKQQEIVDEYNTVVNRIKLNEDLNQKLEEAAQTLYRHWFIDFEFPISKEYAEGINKPELEGKPYKLSGGEMVYSELLEKEIPAKLKTSKLEDLVLLSQGTQVEVDEQYYEPKEDCSRFVRIIDYTEGAEEPPRFIKNRSNRYFASVDDVVMIRYGDAGTVCRRIEGYIANNLFKIIPDSQLTSNYLYYLLKSPAIQNKIKGSSASSAMPAITHKAIKNLAVVIPNEEILRKFDSIAQSIENYLLLLISEKKRLKELRQLILGKMSQSDKVLDYEIH